MEQLYDNLHLLFSGDLDDEDYYKLPQIAPCEKPTCTRSASATPAGQLPSRQPLAPPPPVTARPAALSWAAVSRVAHLPLIKAAEVLGVGPTRLKCWCRAHYCPRWPYRTIQQVDSIVEDCRTIKAAKKDAELVAKWLELSLRMQLKLAQDPCSKVPRAFVAIRGTLTKMQKRSWRVRRFNTV
jgi:hypothetical protein